MMKKNKILPVAAAAIIIFCGCEADRSKTEIKENNITLWMPLVEHVTAENFGDTEIAKAVMERTGVKVDFIHPPRRQESEKFDLLIASADLPDIIEYNWLTFPGGPA